jgi:hypothetical protein
MNVGVPILEVESDFPLLEKGVDRIKGLSLAEVRNSVFAESGQAQLRAHCLKVKLKSMRL